MVLVAAFVIVAAAIAVVLWPLLRARPAEATSRSWERDRLEELLSRRDSAYGALQDLDFEYRLGNLSEADYMDLRERYRERAARVLRRLDRLAPPPAATNGEQPAEQLAEQAVPLSQAPGPSRGQAPAANSSLHTCPYCGLPTPTGRGQCEHCGTPLEADHEA